ncbi:PREDICTED: coiled-coil domain-containing protein 186 [Nicrophorus vespilloides]|uniref:Coiled-coil domain-containing protein 186 n=1 Tax=Nicrophorus vespilloides TaxID=110193 RepID=A0ABM1MQX4_NICVS|nr:PREDICTED: coiled-coil domain-containing protein 186 [Nicrophorus vespilloides]
MSSEVSSDKLEEPSEEVDLKQGENVEDTQVNNLESDSVKELNELIAQLRLEVNYGLDRIKQLESQNDRVQGSLKELKGSYDLVIREKDNAFREKDNAIREKESMVMRYAVSEKNVLQQQSAKEMAEKKLKEAHRENDLLQHKLTSMGAEKTRICNLLDNKCYELKSSQQEYERIKSDLNALETKLKWSQNSLKNEIEYRKDAEAKVDSLNGTIQDAINDAEKTKQKALDSIKEFETSQENRAYTLDQQVKELQATQILLRHEREDRELQVRNLQMELEKSQKKQCETLQENNCLSMKVQQLEKERSELEQKFSELKECSDQQKQNSAELHAKTAQLEQMRLQLTNEQEQLLAANEQIFILRQRNSDLLADIESCRHHEAELLSFTHQLTDKNVRLQSEFTAMETKVQQLTCEQAVLKRSAKEHETKASLLSTQLLEFRNKSSEEIARLTYDLSEAVKLSEKLKQDVADQKGENTVIKRKLELSLREVNKELTQCRKKLEQYENVGTASSSSSSTSLNTVERNDNSPTPSNDQVKVVQPEREVDKQTLIEHIVKLQRASARKSEKLDFLEEHVNTLVAELQKKSRLLQSYVLREQAGTLSSNMMDNNKAHLAKHSGVMASMYGSKVLDENLTLELSLDINRKLQAVLEDALLKNITLKESVDTLGAEIDKLLKKSEP